MGGDKKEDLEPLRKLHVPNSLKKSKI